MTKAADRLRQNRDSVATGKLSLDRRKAREKLRLFRLPSPAMYVLQFVRAASVLGATEISFDIRAMTMICRFDAEFEREQLEDIWSPMFDERTTSAQQAVHNLALGISSAQALNPLRIEVESGATRLVVYADREEVEDIDAWVGTTIRVEEKFRLGHVIEFFTSLADEMMEANWLRRRCFHSVIDVHVNGRRANRGLAGPEELVEAETSFGSARALTVKDLTETMLVLLRDDVEIARRSRPPHIVGVRAALNSRTAVTDLSGLQLQEAAAPYWDALTSITHEALYRWLVEHARFLSRDELRQALERLSSFVVLRSAEELPVATRKLVEWLIVQPVFRSAIIGSSDWCRLHDAETGDPVRYATERVVLPEAEYDVVSLRPGSWIIQLLQRMEIPLVDVTEDLREAALRARNRARWLNRPVIVSREFVARADRRIVEGEGLRGVVGLESGVHGVGRLILDGRLLRYSRCQVPFDVLIEGELQPNERFDGVVRDARFDALALTLLKRTRELFDQMDVLDQLWTLERIVMGKFEIDLLEAVGYSAEEARQTLAEHGFDRSDDPFGLNFAGKLATARLFDGESLQLICEMPTSPIFADEPDRYFSEEHLVLTLTPAQKRIVRIVRPHASDFESTVRRERQQRDFLSRPPYSPPPELNPIWRAELVGWDFRAEAMLRPRASSESGAEVIFLRGERELAREEWHSPPGDWVVVVRSDTVEPTADFSEIQTDEAYEAIGHAINGLLEKALGDWWQSQIRQGYVESEHAALFVEAAFRGPGDEIVLPVSRFDGANWTRSLATLDELEAAAAWTDSLEWVEPGGSFRGKFAPGDIVVEVWPERLQKVDAFRQVRFVQAGPNTVSAVRREYIARAPRRSSLEGALLQWRGQADGFHVQLGLYRGEPLGEVELLWLNRVLERTTLEAPGRFMANVFGEAISANERLTAVSEGREQALAAVELGIARFIESACTQIEQRVDERLSERLEMVRSELVEIAKRTAPGAPWHEPLQSARLVDTPAGRRSLRELQEVRSKAKPQLLGVVEDLLETARDGRRELLADFTLESLQWSDVQQSLCEAADAGVTVRRDHELVRLAERSDRVGAAFLASCVYTQINAYYAEISDTDEIALQRRLLGVV